MDRRIILTLLVIAVASSEPQRGPPPPSHYSYGGGGGGRGPPPRGPYGPPKLHHHSKPTGPNSSVKMLNWLGSQMAKLPGFRTGPPKRPHPRPSSYPPHGPPPHGSQYGSQPYGSASVIFPRPPGPGGNSISSSDPSVKVFGAPYYMTSSAAPSNVYYSQGPQGPPPSIQKENTIYQIISPDGSSRYQSSPPAGYESFFGQQQQATQAVAPPPPSTSQQAQQSQIYQQQYQTYQYPSQQSPGGFQSTQTSGNMEILPSKMVSYEKETISTGHPDYQAAVDGMDTASSSFPAYNYPQAPQPPPQQQYQQGDYYGQQVNQVGDNLGALFQGISPQVAPIYDLSQMDMQGSASQQAPQVSIEGLMNQGGDLQTDYSQSSVSVMPPPPGFHFQQGEQDQIPEGSNNGKQVQILNHGDQGGNPTFEIIADANAPTFDGGHPFDINQLISMIEPGAKVDAGDIMREAESQGQEQYAPMPMGIQKQKLETLNPLKTDMKSGQSQFNFPAPTAKSKTTSKISFPVDKSTENSHLKETPIFPPEQSKNSIKNPSRIQSLLSKLRQTDNKTDISTSNFQTQLIKGVTLTLTDHDHYMTATTDTSTKTKIKPFRKVIYHTVQPVVNFLNITRSKDPNHNYSSKNATATNSSSMPPLNHPSKWNPLFDSVEKKIIFRNRGLLKPPSSDGDGIEDPLETEESRQVQMYSITVTPPPHMFHDVQSTTPISEETSTVPSEMFGDLMKPTRSGSLVRKVTRTKNVLKTFPVYRRPKIDDSKKQF